MQQSDATAQSRFVDLYEREYPHVWRYCRRRLPGSDVDDVVAAVFTTAWRRLAAVPTPPADRWWLYAVSRNEVGHRIRSRHRNAALSDRLRLVRDDHVGDDPTTAGLDGAADLLRAVRRLHERDQELIRLVAWERLTVTEVAATLGCTTNAASIRLHRARRNLRRELDRVAKASDSPGNLMMQPIVLEEGGPQ
jgi:RNA polymerase sigma-70 factor (ECF subfamily)